MYAFGAMLSFTIAHAAVIQMRRKPPPVEEPYRVRPSLRVGGVDWPLFAIVGGLGTGLAWLVVVVQDAPTRYAGLALARGRVRLLRASTAAGSAFRCARRCARRSSFGPAVALEYRIDPRADRRRAARAQEAIDLAARLAAERGATIVALRVLVVPLDRPLDSRAARARRREADRLLDDARNAASSLRRAHDRPPRPLAQRGPRDRGGGRAAPVGDRRPRRPARLRTARSSARRSTTCSRTLRAA